MVSPVEDAKTRLDEQNASVEELRTALADVRRSNAELEQFAYVVSHDLREPLRMVTSYAQLLARRYGGHLDADGEEFLGYITDGARRMERLIEDILSFSRVGRCAIPPTRFDSRDALDAALDDLTPLIQETKAVIKIGPMPSVVADRGQLERVFENMLSNALKYRRPDATPIVQVEGDECEAAWHFSVTDNGIGIPPAEQERIFLVFERLHGRDIPGTGLGLAICKKIVERHGGRLWVNSQPGQGSSFHFTLARREP